MTPLVDAVRDVPEPTWLKELGLEGILSSCRTLKQAGCSLAWLFVNAERLSSVQQNSRFVDGIFAIGAWHRVWRSRQALPIKEGDFGPLVLQLRSLPLESIREEPFVEQWSVECWTMLACYSCNAMVGSPLPFQAGSWSKLERELARSVATSADRLVSHGDVSHCDLAGLEKELKSKRVGYSGEEIGICHTLSMEQVLPSLPPKEHGGCFDILKFVSSSTRHFLTHPSKMIVKDVGQELPRLQGKIHIEKGAELPLARELVERGVCRWVPLDAVVTFRGQRVLNGLFGVEKPACLASGKPILRLIMNLVPSNSILKSFSGAVSNLPHITAWMSTVIEDGCELRIWQSDMQNAFYLFRIPDSWAPMLAFNLTAPGQDIGLEHGRIFALSCCVLPMGWSSSVAIMQEASENILEKGMLPVEKQLSRGRAVPPWMTNLLEQAGSQGRAWWHVYLDNFAAGQVAERGSSFAEGEHLHQLAEEAWAASGVVSSSKKRKSAELEAQELGAMLDGDHRTMGGSPERLLKLIQATLILLKQIHLSKKLTQVVAGRWVHVFQFRRPAMALLESTWAFVGSKQFQLNLVWKVRRELFWCICAVPFLHCYLGAGISPVMTASDASMAGGAVGVATDLSAEGKDFVGAAAQGHHTVSANVLLISLFNGIGGALRCYDILGVAPRYTVVCDIHGPAQRVTAKRWPSAEAVGDVRSINEEMVDGWFRKIVPLEEVHVWSGFPCTDLSSAKARREGLDGEASGLFWEVVRILKLLKTRAPMHLVIKFVAENVASMAKNDCLTISQYLEVFPYWFNCAHAVPMNRPRLCWTSEEIEGVLEGLHFVETEFWTEGHAEAEYPDTSQWISDGAVWPGQDEGAVFPTAMKAIVRRRPPERPAGLSRCDPDTLGRWQADQYRFPPYHYLPQFVIWKGDQWRLTNSSERELLLGYGWNHTRVCMSASDIKRSAQAYEDERLSLLGDSFSIYSFVIAAAALCRRWLPTMRYSALARRMGMAPGFRAPLRWQIPLSRSLKYGSPSVCDFTVQDLNKLLLTKVNHTGSDIRITTGEPLCPKSIPRQSVEAAWWSWKPSFKTRWKQREHINVLELRSILLAVKYQVSHFGARQIRLFHVSDSFVAMSVVAKGRSGSRQLNAVLKLLNGVLLGFGLTLCIGHVESTENPTDGESRSMAFLY